MVKIENLAFNFGSYQVLRDISTELQEGRIYGLLGENGVGKTTLLTLLSGLKKCSSGSIDIDGHDPYKREVSFLQSLYYLPDEVASEKMTADKYAKITGQFWPNFDMDKFTTIMKEFETDPDKYMNKMSAGQLKKTYIAFALSCNTKYLFMDEPTNGLDIPSKTQFRSAITRYTSDDSVILISTHQVRDLENLISPVIILDKQDVLLNADVEEIAEKLYFDYSSEINPNSLYQEALPGGYIQVYPNTTGKESKVNIEALFNTVHNHKELIKNMFNNKEA